jgi:hypothetical protein
MTPFWQIVVAVLVFARPAVAETGIGEIWHQTHWGESANELLRQFGADAIQLPRALDFGDSYATVALPSQMVGAVPMVVFFQMDKATHGLKRIQFERPRHGVNPPAFRGILAALQTDFGSPDRVCAVPVFPTGGYQAGAKARSFATRLCKPSRAASSAQPPARAGSRVSYCCGSALPAVTAIPAP